MINYGRSEVEQIVSWCIKKWKISEYVNTKPKLRVYKSCGNTYGIKAEYNSDKNVITIYLGAINDLEELCGIVIHEYWHYLLNPKEFEKLYYDMLDEGYNEKNYYKFHPHEIICKAKQDGYKYECICDLMTKYKIKLKK